MNAAARSNETTRPAWLEELDALAIKFAHVGALHDLAALSAAEAWGVLRYLRDLDAQGKDAKA